MLTKKRYSVKDMVLWTRGETLIYLLYAGIITVLYKVFGFTFLNVPWTPVALIGTAVAFLVGFQNNSAYGRIWEARMIWGAIVNTSRTWGMKIQDVVSNQYCKVPISEDELESDVELNTNELIEFALENDNIGLTKEELTRIYDKEIEYLKFIGLVD